MQPRPVHDDLYEENATAWMMATHQQIVGDVERFTQSIVNVTKSTLDFVSLYVDLDYLLWIRWLLSPLVITFFILPTVILLFIYVSALILYIARVHKRRQLPQRVVGHLEDRDFWAAGRLIVATLWDGHAWLWHGYAVDGIENIPESGGALLVYYHGALPVDYYYLVTRILLVKGVMIHSVVDKFLFSVPGLRIVLDAFCCTPGTVDSCATVMKEGHLLGLAPGGVYEAQFGDSNYELLWKDRLGFAKAAIAAGVPVIPVFTENVRESFRVLGFGRRFFYWLFRKTKLPLRPVYGGFPVKLYTHIGKPIEQEPGITPEQLRDRCKESVEMLINRHQRKPGSIFRGIFDRFCYRPRAHND